MIKIAEIIRLSWQVYITNFKKFLHLLAIFFGISIISSLITYYLSEWSGLSQTLAIILSIAFSFLISLASMLISILIILYVNSALNNKQLKYKLGDALAVFWPFLWLSLVTGALTVVGYILVIIPGIILTVWLAFVTYIVILEKKTGLQVLKESRELSRGRFWPVLWRILVPGLFWGLISYLVFSGFMNILGLALNTPLNKLSATDVWTNILVVVISALISTFFIPLFIAGSTIVYREVRK